MAGRGNFQAGAAGELGLRNVPRMLTRNRPKRSLLHESFVRHHRIKEDGMRGTVARFRLDHSEFLRQ